MAWPRGCGTVWNEPPDGEISMRVLVAVASKHGATRGIAEAIADRLRERGLAAHVSDASDVQSLDDIDAVVLGSAVYAGRWRKDARHAVLALEAQLRER